MAYGKWHQGRYRVMNPDKYVGDPDNITFRSSWERVMCKWLDETDHILKWQSEEQRIPYMSPVDDRRHDYVLDFVFWANTATGVKKFMIEVKPESQTKEPRKGPNETEYTFQERVKEWLINQAKWNAARALAKTDGSEFVVLTEKHIMPSQHSIKPYKAPKAKVKNNANASRKTNPKTR